MNRSDRTADAMRDRIQVVTNMNRNQCLELWRESFASPPARTLKPGMRLLREWNGKTYEVAVTENGFIWRDKHYRSLSAIAREITGTRWSGPRFFGVDVA